MTRGTGEEWGVRTTKTTFDIIETIYEADNIQLMEVAEAVGIANSTAFEHLTTLERFGYVVREADGYRLGLKLLDQGTKAKQHYSELIDASEGVLEQLVKETDEAVNLVVEEHSYAVYIIRLTGERGVPTNSWVGKRKQMHTLSAGKAILAHMTDERVDEVIRKIGLEEMTPETITTKSELEAECEEIRERGVAFNDRESHGSIRAVGSPIIHDSKPIGAVSVAGPARRLTDDYFNDKMPKLLLGAVDEIELKLTYM